MDYNDAIGVLRRRCIEKKHPTYGSVSISPDDLDPPTNPPEMLHFCQWLHENGYTRRFPGQGQNGEWLIDLSPLALIQWEISENDG